MYLNPFQQWLYDFEIHFFTLRTTEGLICNYSTRFKRSRMLQKKKRCIKSFFLIFPKYHIFSSFSTALQKLQKTFKCFPEDKIIQFTLIFKFKKFSPLALNAWFCLLEHLWVFEPSVIVAYESLSHPQCEKMDLKILQSLLERVQIGCVSLVLESEAVGSLIAPWWLAAVQVINPALSFSQNKKKYYTSITICRNMVLVF